jgi:polysaccharide export outer membrane protein
VYNNPGPVAGNPRQRSGTISYPLIGVVSVGGLPTAAAEKKLAQLLQSGGLSNSRRSTSW